jgi:hypothetical protein
VGKINLAIILCTWSPNEVAHCLVSSGTVGQCTAAGSTACRQIDQGAAPNLPCRGAALAVPSVVVVVAAWFTMAARLGHTWGGAGVADLQRSGGKSARRWRQRRNGGRERARARLNFPSSWFFARKQSNSTCCSRRPTYGA